MFRGTALQFRLFVYFRLIRSWAVRIGAPSMATLLVLAIIGSLFYLDSSLAFASQGKPTAEVYILPHNTKPVEELITSTKPTPRSRLNKSSTKIFSTNTHEQLSMPAADIELTLPILMYHKTPEDFESQLQDLQAKGYTAITMRIASRILRDIEPSPLKPVVITYDDGFSDQLTAFELLRRYNMPATFYVMPGGELSQWCVGAERSNNGCGDSYLNWNEIKMLSDSGLVEIGSHTTDHAQLNALDSNTKRDQIFNAKKIIEQKTGKQVVSFAYPYGAFDSETIQLAREAGYTSAVSTIGGTSQSTSFLFELRRVRNAYDLP